MSDNNTNKDKTLKQRDQIAKEYKWDIKAMYPDESQWDGSLTVKYQKGR